MPERPRRIEIGFSGGQVVSVRLSVDQLAALRQALGGEGWHEVATEDGDVVLDLGEVVFVRGEAGDHRVGFSSAER
jgi:hypothetical protein